MFEFIIKYIICKNQPNNNFEYQLQHFGHILESL